MIAHACNFNVRSWGRIEDPRLLQKTLSQNKTPTSSRHKSYFCGHMTRNVTTSNSSLSQKLWGPVICIPLPANISNCISLASILVILQIQPCQPGTVILNTIFTKHEDPTCSYNCLLQILPRSSGLIFPLFPPLLMLTIKPRPFYG